MNHQRESARNLMLRAALVILGVWSLFLMDVRPAHADLKLCNNTPSRVGVAIGYRHVDEEGGAVWISEGWWNISANSCLTILSGDLIARYYYVYAVDYDSGGDWSGKAFLCIQDAEFKIVGNTECTERGYARQGFDEIDTGENSDFTVSLTGASSINGQNQ